MTLGNMRELGCAEKKDRHCGDLSYTFCEAGGLGDRYLTP
jgi:hypothetical protein